MNRDEILVTGFMPFLNHSVNPTQQVLPILDGYFVNSFKVKTLLLPVSFQKSVELVLSQIKKENYKSILMLGLAGDRFGIHWERVALNWVESNHADEDGVALPTGYILPEAPSAYIQRQPLEKWCERLNDKAPIFSVSLSAGGYVCNHLFFRVMDAVSQGGYSLEQNDVYFVHVPPLEKLSLNELGDQIKKIIELM